MPSTVLLVLFVLSQASPADCDCDHCAGKLRPISTATSKTTQHFVVRSYSTDVNATELAKHAEARRKELARTWLTDAEVPWSPRCEIIVHANRQTYHRAIGQVGTSTLGSTLIRYSQGRVALRRIDLLADRAERPFETLAHELVHVIFADRFPKAAPPRWAEEGAALMADTEEKRRAHRRDFAEALRANTAFHVCDLVRMSEYPPPTRFAAFYGQSLVLVDFLCHMGEPGDFPKFVERSMEVGHDKALKEIYGIASTSQLEDLWREKAVKAALAVN